MIRHKKRYLWPRLARYRARRCKMIWRRFSVISQSGYGAPRVPIVGKSHRVEMNEKLFWITVHFVGQFTTSLANVLLQNCLETFFVEFRSPSPTVLSSRPSLNLTNHLDPVSSPMTSSHALRKNPELHRLLSDHNEMRSRAGVEDADFCPGFSISNPKNNEKLK